MQAVCWGAEMLSCSSGWTKAASGCLMAPASLWAGHSQPSRSLRPMITSCALCLLRGAQCRQSAGVLSSSASACHHSKAASGCLMAPASRWAGHSQPSRSLRPMTTSCALCLLRGAQCRQGCRDVQLHCIILPSFQSCQWVPHGPSKPVGLSQPSRSLRLMTTSCALCLLRGAQCRQSAGVQRCSAAHLAGPKLPVGASWPQQACGLVTASPAGHSGP